jgi:hypothetical protein
MNVWLPAGDTRMDEWIYEYGRQYEYTTPGNRNQYVALQLAIGGLRLLEENDATADNTRYGIYVIGSIKGV